MPVWFPKRDSLLSLRTPVFTAELEPGGLEVGRSAGAPGRHAMVVRAQIVNANNTIPKNFAPFGMQSEVELVVTLERQYVAGHLVGAKRIAKSSTFGVFLGSANLLPVLCGERFWLPLCGIKRVSFSRIAGPQELEIQGEPQDEDALLPRVGSPLEYAGNDGENRDGGAPGAGGGNFSSLPQTTGLAQTEAKEQIVGGSCGGVASQGHILEFVTSRTTCAVRGWKLHMDTGKP